MAIDFKPLTLTPVEFSLTEGTQIPAPLDSPPITPIRSRLAPLEEEEQSSGNDTNSHADGSKRPHNLKISTPDSKAAPPTPLSPMSASSQSRGVRKFLSLRSLRGESRRHNRRAGELSPTTTDFAFGRSSRPGSPYTMETAISAGGESGQMKRNPSWFGSASSRRTSQLFLVGRLDERIAKSASPEQQKPRGPPPPSIPEFSLGRDLEMGGADLFKNIK